MMNTEIDLDFMKLSIYLPIVIMFSAAIVGLVIKKLMQWITRG